MYNEWEIIILENDQQRNMAQLIGICALLWNAIEHLKVNYNVHIRNYDHTHAVDSAV